VARGTTTPGNPGGIPGLAFTPFFLNTVNVSGLCVVALSINLKLTRTLDRAITQSPCYVPLNFTK